MTETAMNLDRKKVAVAAMIAGGVLLTAFLGWMLVSGTGDVPTRSAGDGRQAVGERGSDVTAPDDVAPPTDAEADASARKAVTTRTEAKQALSELDGEIDAAGSGTGE